MSDQEQARANLVQALRSGEYKQGERRLRKDDTFCCLGVACDLYREATGEGMWMTDPHGDYHFALYQGSESGVYTMDSSFLPTRVREFYGFAQPGGEYEGSALYGENDDGKTFEEIADIIESKPEGLFVS